MRSKLNEVYKALTGNKSTTATPPEGWRVKLGEGKAFTLITVGTQPPPFIPAEVEIVEASHLGWINPHSPGQNLTGVEAEKSKFSIHFSPYRDARWVGLFENQNHAHSPALVQWGESVARRLNAETGIGASVELGVGKWDGKWEVSARATFHSPFTIAHYAASWLCLHAGEVQDCTALVEYVCRGWGGAVSIEIPPQAYSHHEAFSIFSGEAFKIEEFEGGDLNLSFVGTGEARETLARGKPHTVWITQCTL